MNCPLPKHEAMALMQTGLRSGRMLELGDKANATGVYKDYFAANFEHTSIDINGQHGALPRDLCVRGSLADLGEFDVCTNFGTTEHVLEQEPCWENIHNAISVGGWLVSTTPVPGTWSGHGRFYPYLDWYARFCWINGYQLRVLSRVKDMNVVVARKTETCVFAMPENKLMSDEGSGKVGNYG